jgi:hypothetical protein
MRRREFLQGIAATATSLEVLSRSIGASAQSTPVRKTPRKAEAVSLEGYTLVAEFKGEAKSWKVYEDLRTREGTLVFVSSSEETRVLRRRKERLIWGWPSRTLDCPRPTCLQIDSCKIAIPIPKK